MVLVLMFGGRRLHALFPGVLIAVALGILFSELAGYDGELVGDIPVGAPPISLALPWAEVGSLMLPAVVICLVSIAQAGSIARTFAALDGRPWNANREFVSQGLANLTAGPRAFTRSAAPSRAARRTASPARTADGAERSPGWSCSPSCPSRQCSSHSPRRSWERS